MRKAAVVLKSSSIAAIAPNVFELQLLSSISDISKNVWKIMEFIIYNTL